MIKVLIVDDHTLVREGLRSLLESDPGFEVVGEASNGEEAVQAAGSLKPDVILMDIQMPVMDGLAATTKIKELGQAARVLILSQDDSQKALLTSLEVGSFGYVLKTGSIHELVWAIKTVHDGNIYLTPRMTQFLLRERSETKESVPKADELLTAREQEVLKLVAEGLTNKEIAEKLVISLRTVETHRAHIMEKLNFHDRTELIKYAIRTGVVEP